MHPRLRSKPALRSVNHWQLGALTTVAATDLQTPIVTGIEPPTTRGLHVPVGAIITDIKVEAFATDATPVNGRHQCMLLWRSGGQVFANPVASWYDTTDPMSEDAIEIRRANLSPVITKYVITGHDLALKHICTWRGKRVVRDGDDVILNLLDTTATNWWVLVTTGYYT